MVEHSWWAWLHGLYIQTLLASWPMFRAHKIHESCLHMLIVSTFPMAKQINFVVNLEESLLSFQESHLDIFIKIRD
jgi:hypothetical protein